MPIIAFYYLRLKDRKIIYWHAVTITGCSSPAKLYKGRRDALHIAMRNLSFLYFYPQNFHYDELSPVWNRL